MARPRLPDRERREHSTRADLTAAEKAELTRKAKLAGLSEAELIRTLIRDGRVVSRGGGVRHDPALVCEVNRLALQLKYAGVTANKLAIAVHTDTRFRGEWERVASELDSARAEASAVLGRIV